MNLFKTSFILKQIHKLKIDTIHFIIAYNY